MRHIKTSVPIIFYVRPHTPAVPWHAQLQADVQCSRKTQFYHIRSLDQHFHSVLWLLPLSVWCIHCELRAPVALEVCQTVLNKVKGPEKLFSQLLSYCSMSNGVLHEHTFCAKVLYWIFYIWEIFVFLSMLISLYWNWWHSTGKKVVFLHTTQNLIIYKSCLCCLHCQ